ncbi:MAG: tautomerase family protein [Thermodesulfobacteriota bacterium]|nr:tautomerase family protein [Thermodesulfobacteriota bacterium]
MPHIIVKLWPGRSEDQKQQLAGKIAEDVRNTLECKEESISVAIEEIEQADWKEKVYQPDILTNIEKLYKKPGYSM